MLSVKYLKKNWKIPLQVCYWEGYCDESSNPSSGKSKNKEKVMA